MTKKCIKIGEKPQTNNQNKQTNKNKRPCPLILLLQNEVLYFNFVA